MKQIQSYIHINIYFYICMGVGKVNFTSTKWKIGLQPINVPLNIGKNISCMCVKIQKINQFFLKETEP